MLISRCSAVQAAERMYNQPAGAQQPTDVQKPKPMF
jgi:hypothetical protein